MKEIKFKFTASSHRSLLLELLATNSTDHSLGFTSRSASRTRCLSIERNESTSWNGYTMSDSCLAWIGLAWLDSTRASSKSAAYSLQLLSLKPAACKSLSKTDPRINFQMAQYVQRVRISRINGNSLKLAEFSKYFWRFSSLSSLYLSLNAFFSVCLLITFINVIHIISISSQWESQFINPISILSLKRKKSLTISGSPKPSRH